MRLPNNQRDRALFEEIFSDKDRAGDALTWTVSVGGRTLKATEPRAYTEATSVAAAFEANTPVPLSKFDEGKEVRVDLRIEGRPWKDYEGFLTSWTREDDGTGTMIASTAGYYQDGDDSVKWNQEKSFNTTPQKALAECLQQLPYKRVMVPDIGGKNFIRLHGDNSYSLDQSVGDTIGDIETENKHRQKDTFLNWGRVFPEPTIARIATLDAPRHWREGREVQTFTWTRRTQARFFDVGVFREAGDGIFISLVEPRPEVRYPAGVSVPPRNATYWIPISDVDTLTTDVRSMVFSLASSLYPGEFDVELTLPFVDPRIEDFDVRTVTSVNNETGEETTFRCIIEAQQREYATPQHILTGTGMMLGRVEQKKRVMDSISEMAISAARKRKPPVGGGGGGDDLFPSDTLYPSDTLVPS